MGMVCDIATTGLVRLMNFGWSPVVVVRHTQYVQIVVNPMRGNVMRVVISQGV